MFDSDGILGVQTGSDALRSSAPWREHTFFLGGPTGVGKSEFAWELASRIHGEVLGADAFQIYSGLRLLSAQPECPTKIPHWMVACIAPQESYHAARYQREATQRLEEILQRGKIPIVVGGTGLYFQALLQGFDPAPPSDPLLRCELEGLSLPMLQQRLAQVDPTAVTRIDMNNPRRVLRAIEICELSGRPLKDYRTQKRPISAARGWVLLREQGELDHRIAANVKHMWKEGVVEEVQSIRDQVGPTASRAIGFREILAFLDGKITETQCQEAIYLSTRRYAKRQLTWFRHQTKFRSLNLSLFQSASSAVATFLDEITALGKTPFSEDTASVCLQKNPDFS